MFDIVDFISRIFKKDKADETRSRAKERLKLVLVSDRASISPQMMENLREELIEVISRYMTIDTNSMEMGLERKEGSVALAANIPILNVRRVHKKSKPERTSEKLETHSEDQQTVQTIESLYSSEPIPESRDRDNEASAEKALIVESKAELVTPQLPVESYEDQEQIEFRGRKKSRRGSRKYQAQARGKSLRKRVD